MSEDGSSKKPKVHHLNPRRRQKLKQGGADASPQELARRQEQQRRREIALKLRAEGRTYNPRVLRRKHFTSEGFPARKQVRVKVKASQRNKQPYHVVILPIAWKQRREEAASIDAACQEAAQHLREAGITLTIDESDTYTPGQKMKFWEQRGVKVRLEIGPKEALAGTAILALATTPGQVAQKQSVKVKPELLVPKVKEALEKQGVDLAGVQPGAAVAEGTGAAVAAGGGPAADSQADGQEKQKVKAKTPRKRSAEEQEEQQAGAEQGAAAAEDAELQGKKKKKKKHLVEDGQQAMAVAEQMAHAGGSSQPQHTAKQQNQKQQEPAEAQHQQQQQQGVKVAHKQQQQQQRHTGDELEDDFGELLDEPVVAGGKAGKKQNKKKQREAEPSAAASGFAGAPAKQPKPAGVKKHKVVKF